MNVRHIELREVETNLTHTGIRCVHLSRKPKPRKMITIQGLYDRPYACFRSTIKVALAVIMERVFYHIINGVAVEPFRPSVTLVNQILAPAWHFAKRALPISASWSHQQFVDSYHGRKKGVYARALTNLSKLTLSVSCIKRLANLKSFIKVEKLPVLPNKRLVPRLIQPRTPEFNILLGSYLRSIEHTIYRKLQEMFETPYPVVSKGFNSNDFGQIIYEKWKRISLRGKPVAIGLDMSRFDQHISQAMLKWEHRWYTQCFYGVERKELAKLLRNQLVNKGFVLCDDGIVKYEVEGTRGSGDMNTGLGNCIIMCSLIYSFLHSRNIPLNEVEIVDNGDDSLIITTSNYLTEVVEHLPSFVQHMGFVLKMEDPVYEIEHMSFCQLRPINIGDDKYVLSREWPRCVSKDTVVIHSCKNREYFLQYMASIGVGGVKMCKGIPILQSWYLFLSKLSTPLSDRILTDLCLNMWVEGLEFHEQPITDQARLSFYKAFNITPEAQIAMEDYYKNLNINIEWNVESIASEINSLSLAFNGVL